MTVVPGGRARPQPTALGSSTLASAADTDPIRGSR